MSTNAATRRSHRIIEILARHGLDGTSNRALAAAIGTSPPNISRDIQTLADIGYVRKTETGRYALTPKVLEILREYGQACSAAHDKIEQHERSLRPQNHIGGQF